MTSDTESIDVEPLVAVEQMTRAQGRRMLSARVRDELHIPLAEFFVMLDTGGYDDVMDDRVLKLVMLAPFAR